VLRKTRAEALAARGERGSSCLVTSRLVRAPGVDRYRLAARRGRASAA